MPKYVIEREIPGLGSLSQDEVRGIAEKSNGVLSDMGGDVQWLQSYNTDDKMFCVYIAPNAERVYEHAHCGGFPADAVREVRVVVDPTTAESPVESASS
jgi:hypothetical protein